MACSRLEVDAFPRAISSQNTLTRRADADRHTATRLAPCCWLVCRLVHGSRAGNKSAAAAALVEIRCNRTCRNCAKKINAGHLYHLRLDTLTFFFAAKALWRCLFHHYVTAAVFLRRSAARSNTDCDGK